MSVGSTMASEHRITHERAPVQWRDGLPLGNGDLGVMFWGDGAPLAFTLDKGDLWDLRSNDAYRDQPEFNYANLCRLVADKQFSEIDRIFEKRQTTDNPIGPTKISIGRAEINLGRAVQYSCSLNLGTASIDGVLQLDDGQHGIRAFVHHDKNVFCLRVASLRPEAVMTLIPLADMNDALVALRHPRPRISQEAGRCLLLQEIPEGLCYAVVWNASGPDFFLAVETAPSAAEAAARAQATWRQADEAGFESLFNQHQAAWDAFWAASAVYLPERRMEFLWYYGLYILASSARRGRLPPGLQGVWSMDGCLPPWRGDYHADLNVQETFWPACASGHLDLLDAWCDIMKNCTEQAKEYTVRFFKSEGTFWPCTLLPGYTIASCWHTVQFAWSHTGWLCWMVWLRWRYSMDVKWLADTGYPLIAEGFKFYRANLREEADGRLHIPVSSSPEYKENQAAAWCKDPNSDIALIRRLCDWLVEMENALGLKLLSPAATALHQRLVPYHLTEKKELCLWAKTPLDESHRHPSHLMAIHPAMDITVDDGEDAREIIRASLEQYFSQGQYLWAGHSYAQLASFGAVVGRGEFAYDSLLHLVEYWLRPNGLHFNRDLRATGTTFFREGSAPFTIEANCGAAAGISDMLVQGWHDVVRVFPAMPEHWRDAAFRELLTEGAFRVSAVRQGSRTVWVQVTAGVKRQLRLRNPFGRSRFVVSGGKVREEEDLLLADLEAGQAITLYLEGKPVDFHSAARLTRQGNTSRIGLV